MKRLTALALPVLLATAANAEPMREFCASRPGLGTPPCTLDPGHVQVEVGLGDWTRDDQDDARTDTILAGDAVLRIGLDRLTEAQIGWTSFGHVRMRDKVSGEVMRQTGTGDVTLGLRRSVSGSGGPVAVQPFVTLPAGSDAIGAGDWGAGFLVPIEFDLGQGLQLAFTPELDAAVDADGSGRHLAYRNVVGLSGDLAKRLTATIELAAQRDDDPAGHVTNVLTSASLAYEQGENTQFDVGAVAGLTSQSPDVELYFGIARRF